MFIWFSVTFVRLFWLTLKHLVTGEGPPPAFLVTDGQFEWTSPFLTQRDWASEDDEWGCSQTSFSSVSPSPRFLPRMRRRNSQLTDFYTPTSFKWRNSFSRSSKPDDCKLDHHPMNTLRSHLCVFHPEKALIEDVSLKTEITLWSRVLVFAGSHEPGTPCTWTPSWWSHFLSHCISFL